MGRQRSLRISSLWQDLYWFGDVLLHDYATPYIFLKMVGQECKHIPPQQVWCLLSGRSKRNLLLKSRESCKTAIAGAEATATVVKTNNSSLKQQPESRISEFLSVDYLLCKSLSFT